MDHDQVMNIIGERVVLGPMGREQIPVYQLWLNNFHTLRTQGEPVPRPETIDGISRWYESYVTGRDDVAWFTVYDKQTDQPIGWTELKEIDHLHRTAEFALMIGERGFRGRGYGTEVTTLMLDYGFIALGLHNIHLYYHEFNIAGRRAYERAGFREYGRRTEAHYMGGRLWDVVLMQCLSSDFQSPVLSEIFKPDPPR
jgi:RimJ/RimL family protein N-acetyltransferase